MDRPMCSALLRFGSFPHHNEVGALVVFSKSAMPRLYGNGMCCSIHIIIQFFYSGKKWYGKRIAIFKSEQKMPVAMRKFLPCELNSILMKAMRWAWLKGTVPNNSCYHFWADLVLRWLFLWYGWHPWILIQIAIVRNCIYMAKIFSYPLAEFLFHLQIKLWQNKKGQIFVSHARQNNVFFGAASWVRKGLHFAKPEKQIYGPSFLLGL